MTTKREKILQKLNPNLLRMTPKLSSSTDSFIDLNTEDSTEAGIKKLMMRFFRNQDLCEKNKRNSVQAETELITHSAKYNENDEICELLSERLTLPSTTYDEDDVSERPGRRLQKLQMELQEKMAAKWEEEYKKRIKEKKVYVESKKKFRKKKNSVDNINDDVQDHDDYDDYDDDDDSNAKRTFEKDNEKDVMKEFENENYDDGDDADIEFDNDDDEEERNESDNESIVNDEKIEENVYDDNHGNNLEKDDEYESCSLVPAYQPGGGMLYGGSELTQCDEELPQNLLSPSLRLSLNETSTSAIKMSSESHSINDLGLKKVEIGSIEEADNSFTVQSHSVKLFTQNPNDSFDLNDAFEFCSGKFPGEQFESQLGIQNIVEENINDSNKNKSDADYNNDFGNIFDENTVSEGLKSQKVISKTRKNIIAFEDSEEEDKEVVNDTELDESDQYCTVAPQLLSDDGDEVVINKKFLNKKKTKSLHFSDEEDATNDCEDEEVINDKSDGAENSEKEDEDDDFEEEKNECDQRSIHYDSEENEIINPKEFFEKEAELSGSEWSGDEDEKGLDEFDVEDGDADIVDNDEIRSQLEKIHIRRVLDDDAREIRFIQEILFEDGDLHSDGKRRDRKFKWKNLGTFDEPGAENYSKEDDGNGSEDNEVEEEELRKLRHEKELFFMTKKKDDDLTSDDDIIKDFLSVKVTQIKASIKLASSKPNAIEDPKTSCAEIFKTTCLSACNARGSFLTRNEQFLSKLAKATSAITDNVLGPKNSKNFVFTTRSPEKTNPNRHAVCKRQVEDMESCSRREKKIKLLSPKTHMGPSILDLLV